MLRSGDGILALDEELDVVSEEMRLLLEVVDFEVVGERQDSA